MATPTPVLGLQAATATDDEPTYLTADLAASLTTLDGLFTDTAGLITVIDPYTQAQLAATPTTLPPAGSMRIYPKDDSSYYMLDDQGVESPLGINILASLRHEEFLPAALDTSVSLAATPQMVLSVARSGVVQSETDGHYAVAGSNLTFATAFDGTERVVVDYVIRMEAPIVVPPISGADIAPDAITSANILDGTIVDVDVSATAAIQGTKLADASVSSAKLIDPINVINLITNPNFQIWQRGTGPHTTPSLRGPDGWNLQIGAGTGTVSVVMDPNNMEKGGACAALTYTVGDVADAVPGMYQDLTAMGVAHLIHNQTFTIAFRIKTAVPGVRAWTIEPGSSARFYSTPHPGDGAYHTLTLTTVGDPVQSNYAGVEFTAGQGGVAYLDWATLALGDAPVGYMPVHPADDLARCQRFYETVGGPGMNDYVLSGYASAGQAVHFALTYKVQKPAVPTITKMGTWGVVNCGEPQIAVASVVGAQAYFLLVAAGYGLIQNVNVGACFVVEC